MQTGYVGQLRPAVLRIWQELSSSESHRGYGNAEGGSVEQQSDRRLVLHHCSNYAAALALFAESGRQRRLLELGCGSGALSAAFGRAMPEEWRLVATDYSGRLIDHARSLHASPRLRFEHADARTLGPERMRGYDGVLLLEVIEHLSARDAADLLGRLYTAMCPGAELVITTPDRAAFSRPFSGYAPHVVEYTASSMRQFLARHSRFESFEVLRLVSPRIAREHVRAEDRGGYLVNRARRLAQQIVSRYPSIRAAGRRAAALGYRVFSSIPQPDRFDLHGYLRTIELVGDDEGTRDADAFSIVVRLGKS